MTDKTLRQAERRGALTFRDLERTGPLTPQKLRSHGFVSVGVDNEGLIAHLETLGWRALGSRMTEGLDCRGWTHCGPECCGPCPTCGDDYRLRNPREQNLVWAPHGLSKTRAKRELHKIMVAFAGRCHGGEWLGTCDSCLSEKAQRLESEWQQVAPNKRI